MDKIAVLDFGGQYAHLIANKIRRLGVYSEIFDGEVEVEKLNGYKGVIMSGGPASVNAVDSVKCDPRILEMGVPILAICYGHQLVAKILGGTVDKGLTREYGSAELIFEEHRGIFEDTAKTENVWMSHFDQVVRAPKGFTVVAKTEDCPIAAMANYDKNIFTLQFHPEVTHTPCGMGILKNFVEITGAKKDWDLDKYIENISEEVKKKVGDRKVFLMISGGVDSSVAFMLLAKALGQDRVYGLFVDTGLMRMNEAEEVTFALKEAGVNNLHVYDASKEFFAELKGVTEPEEKRKIIGNLFLDIKDKVAEDLGLDPKQWMLGQGTIYPDTIESGESRHADKIKTHHNRVDRIQELSRAGMVIEPIDQLYKDEVRLVGRKLGLNEKMVSRHPFPGPGLGVRVLCSDGENSLNDLKGVNERLNDIAGKYGFKAHVLPIKSVGVQGDERTYAHPAVIYGGEIDFKLINRLSTHMTNQLPEVNRVVLALNKVDFEGLTTLKCDVNPERISVIQRADKIAMDFIKEVKIDKDIWQMPTVLVPMVTDMKYESIVLRPVESTEAMTANFYHMSKEHLEELSRRLGEIEEVGPIFYDVTNKPPGTIEWE